MKFSRPLLYLTLVGLALLLIILPLFGWFTWTQPGPAGQPDTPGAVLVNIPQGMTLGAAADTLVARGLLADRHILLVGAKLTGQDRSLRSGLYRLHRGSSPRELLADLSSGRSVQIKVTIPEGLAATEVAEILAAGLGIEAEVVLAAADSLVRRRLESDPWPGARTMAARYDTILAAARASTPRDFRFCEGYLAPDTYLFGAGSSARQVAHHLVATQWARLDSLGQGRGWPNRQADNPHALLTLASVVEAEARLDHERAAIAAVYSNRLARGWRLEADPTVAFVLQKKGKRLFYRDLEVDSPFNTYRQKGLPPGPIGAPGWAALKAAAFPDTTSEAMFFVSDGQGGHVFSRTAAEHEQAVREFRKLKARERRQGGH
jgi:UPF0755 protein|nr:endolytic transglycosylase MltG [Candidatus Krumholzibacteria bacterium]